MLIRLQADLSLNGGLRSGHIVGNMCGSRGGGQGVRTPPPEKSQKYSVSVLYWSGSPVKSHSYQANFQCWATNGPFKWRSAAGPMMARLYWYLDHLSHHQQKKYVVKVGPPLKKLSGSAHGK